MLNIDLASIPFEQPADFALNVLTICKHGVRVVTPDTQTIQQASFDWLLVFGKWILVVADFILQVSIDMDSLQISQDIQRLRAHGGSETNHFGTRIAARVHLFVHRGSSGIRRQPSPPAVARRVPASPRECKFSRREETIPVRKRARAGVCWDPVRDLRVSHSVLVLLLVSRLEADSPFAPSFSQRFWGGLLFYPKAVRHRDWRFQQTQRVE